MRKCEVENCPNFAGTTIKFIGWEFNVCRSHNIKAMPVMLDAERALMELRHIQLNKILHLGPVEKEGV